MADYTYKTDENEDAAIAALSASSGTEPAVVFQALVSGALTAQVDQQKQMEVQILKGESLVELTADVNSVQADKQAEQAQVLKKV